MGYTKLIQFVNTTEVFFYEKKVYPPKQVVFKRKSCSGGFRSERSIRRARQSFFKLSKNHLDANEALPYFITLTYHNEYEVPPSFADSYKFLSSFFKRTKEIFGDHISYIAVPEYQERAFLHFHALVWGLPKSVENERTTRILQRCWLQGYTDVRPAVYKSDALAGYLAKYFTKAYGDGRFFNRKAYTSSRNLIRPTEKGSNDLARYISTFVEKDSLIDRQEYDTKFLGKVIKHTYKNTLLQQQ